MPPIQISEQRGVRYLHFGSELVQGAMRIARPWSLELEYTREMMLPLILRPARWPASVLQLGLGTGSITKFLHRHRPRAKITVVEILPAVEAAARQYFKVPDNSPRLRVEIGEGHEYVACARRTHDFVVVDGFDGEGRAGMLTTTPFYANCRGCLADGGMVAINLIDRGGGVKGSIERLRAAFDGQVLVLPRYKGGNTVALACAGEMALPAPEALHAAARKLKADTGLDLAPTLERLADVP